MQEVIGIPSGDLVELEKALMLGPVSVAVDASNWSQYSSGVMEFEDCGKLQNHAVLLTGVNLDEKYFTIKNSWGSRWGEGGYIRLRLADTCGVADTAFYVRA